MSAKWVPHLLKPHIPKAPEWVWMLLGMLTFPVQQECLPPCLLRSIFSTFGSQSTLLWIWNANAWSGLISDIHTLPAAIPHFQLANSIVVFPQEYVTLCSSSGLYLRAEFVHTKGQIEYQYRILGGTTLLCRLPLQGVSGWISINGREKWARRQEDGLRTPYVSSYTHILGAGPAD